MGVRQGCAVGLKWACRAEMGMQGRDENGGALFMVLVKRCEEAEGSLFFFFSNFHSRKIFATGGKFLLL